MKFSGRLSTHTRFPGRARFIITQSSTCTWLHTTTPPPRSAFSACCLSPVMRKPYSARKAGQNTARTTPRTQAYTQLGARVPGSAPSAARCV